MKKSSYILLSVVILCLVSCNNVGWVKKNIAYYYSQDYTTNNDYQVKLDTAGVYYPLFKDSINLIWPAPLVFGADGLIRTEYQGASMDVSGPYYIDGDTLFYEQYALIQGWPHRRFMQEWNIDYFKYLIRGDTLILYSRQRLKYPEYDYINDSPEKLATADRFVFFKCPGPFYFDESNDIRWQPWIWKEKKQWKEWKKQQKAKK